jgi:MFS family permease
VAGRRRQPWWIPPFLGRVPAEVPDRSLNLLGAVALALLFEEYDLAMLTSALGHIAAELKMAENELSLYLALIRLGALPAFFLVPLADRLGRRPVFVMAVACMGLLTAATAFTQTPMQFVIAQALTRSFFVIGSAVAFVIVTEEFPAAHRGWGMGMLAAIAAAGHGLGALMFSQIERLPYGWRALYVFGLIPVLLVPFFLRAVPETDRFSRHSAELAVDEHSAALSGMRAMFEPLRALASSHPGRALAVAGSGFFAAMAALPCFQFSGKYTQEIVGFTPGEYSLMVVLGGGIGIIGNIVGGRMGDAHGRKIVGASLLVTFPLCAFGFYRGGLIVVVVSWVGLVFCSMGGRLILRAIATEIFPTSQRGAASGMFVVLETLGAVAGLMVIHLFGVEDLRQIATVIPLVALCALIPAALLYTFPETGQRELEDIH